MRFPSPGLNRGLRAFGACDRERESCSRESARNVSSSRKSTDNTTGTGRRRNSPCSSCMISASALCASASSGDLISQTVGGSVCARNSARPWLTAGSIVTSTPPRLSHAANRSSVSQDSSLPRLSRRTFSVKLWAASGPSRSNASKTSRHISWSLRTKRNNKRLDPPARRAMRFARSSLLKISLSRGNAASDACTPRQASSSGRSASS